MNSDIQNGRGFLIQSIIRVYSTHTCSIIRCSLTLLRGYQSLYTLILHIFCKDL